MRFYHLLLHLYPASFRAEYGGEMETDFRLRLRRDSGFVARLGLAFGAILDVLPNALRAHLDILGQDLRHTLRSLSRAPGFAATAILVAALGIGATTATFSILDYALLRPLPFPEPDRLVRLWQDQTFRGYPQMELGAGRERRPQDVVGMVLRRGIALAGAGVVVGVILAAAAGRAMQALLAGVSPVDPAALLAAVVVAVLMTLAGCLAPALRAARLDPIAAIRSE